MRSTRVRLLSLFLAAATLGAVLVLSGNVTAQEQARAGKKPAPAAARFPDFRDQPPKGWNKPVFRLSQDYPQVEPKAEDYPWKKLDFRTQYKDYMEAVLRYALEGNLEVDWDIARNPVRKWYHAPWMHWGANGREFIHGLTNERASLPGELARTQTSTFQNWAVGMYNPPGGYVVGRVWRDPDNPDPAAARFPDGTVALKLLFTQADPSQVSYLKDAKEWQAHIFEQTVVPPNPAGRRSIQTVRLLQIDISVRDSRADSTTGWVFGTFVYNGNLPGPRPWDRLVPVGLMWGNDPKVTMGQARKGHVLKETVTNASSQVPFQHLGWGGRLNGPVDHPNSSCLSCHAAAQWPNGGQLMPPRQVEQDSEEWMKWFRNVKAGEPFTEGSVSLDYSLQLSAGLHNFHEWREMVSTRGGVSFEPPVSRAPEAARPASAAGGGGG